MASPTATLARGWSSVTFERTGRATAFPLQPQQARQRPTPHSFQSNVGIAAQNTSALLALEQKREFEKIAPAVEGWQLKVTQGQLDFEEKWMSHDSDLRLFVFEILGTFVLCVVGSQGRIVAGDNRAAVAVTWGLGVQFGQKFTDHFSGAQLNPGVSIALTLQRKTPEHTLTRVIIAILGQFIGAFLGFGFNYWLSPDQFEEAVKESGTRGGIEMLAAMPTEHWFKMTVLEIFWSTWVGYAIAYATSKMQKYGKLERYGVVSLAVSTAIYLCPMPLSLNAASEVGRRSVAHIAYGKEALSLYSAIGIGGPTFGINLGFLLHDTLSTDRKLLVEAGDAYIYYRPSFAARMKLQARKVCCCFRRPSTQTERDLERGSAESIELPEHRKDAARTFTSTGDAVII